MDRSGVCHDASRAFRWVSERTETEVGIFPLYRSVAFLGTDAVQLIWLKDGMQVQVKPQTLLIYLLFKNVHPEL